MKNNISSEFQDKKKLNIKELREQQRKLLEKLKTFKVRKVLYWDYNPTASIENDN